MSHLIGLYVIRSFNLVYYVVIYIWVEISRNRLYGSTKYDYIYLSLLIGLYVIRSFSWVNYVVIYFWVNYYGKY